MKSFKAVILMLTFGIWGPAWLLRKLARPLAILFVASIFTGCATNSGTFEKSPCACEFERVNIPNSGHTHV